MKGQKKYTWEQINLALMNLGYSPARIWDVLSKLVKVQESEAFLAKITAQAIKRDIARIQK